MDYDVVVIGGGPAGLIAAGEVAGAGYRVCVIEEHQEIGYPVQCSGLYSISGLKALGLRLNESIISSTIRGGRFYSPSGREFTAYSDVERAHVVEKKLFDKHLARRAARAGVEFRLKTRVEGVAVDKRVRVRVEGISGTETLQSALLICADGVRSSTARQLGLKTPKRIVAGIQVEVDNVELGEDIAEVYFGRRYAPNFYAWILPKEDTYEVGLGVRRPKGKLQDYLERFMNHHPVASKKIAGSVVELNIGAFPVEVMEKTVAERTLIVGDAAGQVKASTGGGVITGGIAAGIAGKACVRALEGENYSAGFLKEHYEDRWVEEIGLELKVHMALRELFDSLSDADLEELFNLAREERIDELMVRYQDTDRPSHFVGELLKNERILAAVEKYLNYGVMGKG